MYIIKKMNVSFLLLMSSAILSIYFHSTVHGSTRLLQSYQAELKRARTRYSTVPQSLYANEIKQATVKLYSCLFRPISTYHNRKESYQGLLLLLLHLSKSSTTKKLKLAV